MLEIAAVKLLGKIITRLVLVSQMKLRIAFIVWFYASA